MCRIVILASRKRRFRQLAGDVGPAGSLGQVEKVEDEAGAIFLAGYFVSAQPLADDSNACRNAVEFSN